MKIAHCIMSIDKNNGGTATFLKLIANEIVKNNDIIVANLLSKDPLTLDDKIIVLNAPKSFPWVQGYSSILQMTLKNVACDIFHGNGLWQYPVYSMANIAQKRKIPYIISPHGMLEPWALNAGKWKKKIALKVFQLKCLKKAACIHATADSEAENIRKLGFKNPIAIIPNGIDITEFPATGKKNKKTKRTLLFLSRIHPKKGIELLIEAWLKLNNKKDWQVYIAGNGDIDYIAKLQSLIQRLNLEDEIIIIGPQFGANKISTYQNADLFVLPTYSENFGIVVVEALACGIPVITTKGTPWEILNTHNAGWWIDIGVEQLADTLEKAMQLSDVERHLMGQNGRKLVEENYSIESVASQMIELYDWILGNTEKPSFVRLD